MAQRNEALLPGSAVKSGQTKLTTPRSATCRDKAVICERCGKAEMYRMHAVWRCPDCGFETDCCGW